MDLPIRHSPLICWGREKLAKQEKPSTLAKTILFPILTVTSVDEVKFCSLFLFQASTPDIHLTSNGRGPMSGMGGGLGMNGSSKSLAAGSTHPMLMRSTAGGRGPGDYGPGPPNSTRYAHCSPPWGKGFLTKMTS